MDEKAKKTALRMIPYGLYVLTSQTEDRTVAAATVNWVTQASFEPPLVVVGVKVGSGAHDIIKKSGSFALNVLGKDQAATATKFFKHVVRKDDKVAGVRFDMGSTGAPLLEGCPAYIECSLLLTLEKGDHSIFIGEVKDAGVRKQPEGRPDQATLTLSDLEADLYYGG